MAAAAIVAATEVAAEAAVVAAAVEAAVAAAALAVPLTPAALPGRCLHSVLTILSAEANRFYCAPSHHGSAAPPSQHAQGPLRYAARPGRATTSAVPLCCSQENDCAQTALHSAWSFRTDPAGAVLAAQDARSISTAQRKQIRTHVLASLS